MLEIRCPHCGKRSQNEFSYGGDGNVKRPTLGEEINTKDWDDFVYFRDNPRGKHLLFLPLPSLSPSAAPCLAFFGGSGSFASL